MQRCVFICRERCGAHSSQYSAQISFFVLLSDCKQMMAQGSCSPSWVWVGSCPHASAPCMAMHKLSTAAAAAVPRDDAWYNNLRPQLAWWQGFKQSHRRGSGTAAACRRTVRLSLVH